MKRFKPTTLTAVLLFMALFSSRSIAADEPQGTARPPFFLHEPSDWQVFQRRTRTEGSLRIAGKREANVELQWRLTGEPLEGKLSDQWQSLSITSDKLDFAVEVPAPAGGWYQLEVRGVRNSSSLAEATVDHVGIGEVFIVAGQSNSANHGSERQQTQTQMVSSFDGKAWRLANDPQAGASGTGGSFMPRFGDLMNERFHVPIGILPIGVGSTSVREWLPKGEKVERLTTTGKGLRQIAPDQWEAIGSHFAVLAERLHVLGPNGCHAILWHQGESDAGQSRGGIDASRQISGADYVRYMTILVQSSRKQAGWDVPWFTAQATYHKQDDPADAEFRDAQKSLWDAKLTLAGPDTDALGPEFRQGVHFNGRGLNRHGELWAERVGSWLENQLAAPEK
jgi:hypothetical protein